MTSFRLVLNSLRYYWRNHLAVMFGVMAATAAISGALIVGDSVRGSLRKMSLDRLSSVDHVLTEGRFFREELADILSRDSQITGRFPSIAPAIIVPAALQSRIPDSGNQSIARASQVTIYGVDQRAWGLFHHADIAPPAPDAIVLNERLAQQLSASTGSEITLFVEIPQTIPRDSLLGERSSEKSVVELTLQVSGIAAESTGLARFAINPSQQLPLVAYVNLAKLQDQLQVGEQRRTPKNPEPKPPRVNTLLVAAERATDRSEPEAVSAANTLTARLSQQITLSDLQLRVTPNEKRGYVSLESEQMILDEASAAAGLTLVGQKAWKTSPVLSYLLNEVTNAKDERSFGMYCVVAGVDFEQEKPFGPFEFLGDIPKFPLTPDQVVLNEWLAEDLKAKAGDELKVKYHVVGSRGELPEVEKRFHVAGILKLDGTPADDRGFIPRVPGITDAISFRDWRQPFPMDLGRVTDRDDEYWEKYRATPKVFMSLQAAQDLWRSRYGKLTSLRIALPDGQNLPEFTRDLEQSWLNHLSSEDRGLTFRPVKFEGLQSASATTDFAGLFLGFSFFLILAAVILVWLLFKLGLEKRLSQIGVLQSLGFTEQRVRKLSLTEALLVVGLGGLLGVLAAVAYANLLIYGLKTWWRGAIGTPYLNVFVEPKSLVIGLLIAVGIALLTIWWGLRSTRRLSIREMVHGSQDGDSNPNSARHRSRRTRRIAAAAWSVAGMLLVSQLAGLNTSQEAFSGFSWRVVGFFVMGVAALVGSTFTLAAWLDSQQKSPSRGTARRGLGWLATRNVGRNRSRSLTTGALIATATFVLVAVACGRRNPAVEIPTRNSGNGGFTLVAQTNQPLLFDLNTPAGRKQLGIEHKDAASQELINEMHVVPFRMMPGEDASCLNLYQTRMPTILGVPRELAGSGRFKFADTPGADPWSLLFAEVNEGDPIPCFGDMNTLMYSLHKGIGKTIRVTSESRHEQDLIVRGMLDGSIFQGVLLVSDEHFQKLFPAQAGYRYFLIEIPLEKSGQLSRLLETDLEAFGFDAQRVSERLAAFLAVQNTYLSTFQAVGGLGLLLGTLGLAIVMLRNVLERRGEIALLRSVGFVRHHIARLILWENGLLLAWGLVTGAFSALLAMLPHLLSSGADVPWGGLMLLLAGIFCCGMVSAVIAVFAADRTPIVATLRGE